MKKIIAILLSILIMATISLSVFACAFETPLPTDDYYSGQEDPPSGGNTLPGESTSVSGVSLNFESLSLYLNKSYSIEAAVLPATAANKAVTWTSSNDSVASVVDGVITTKATGEATITVSTVEGNYKATCKVTVQEKPSEGTTYVPDETDANILIIREAGETTLDRDYKQVYVNAPGATVVVNLNGHTVENNGNSPIFVASCDAMEISATKDLTSAIRDTRGTYTEDASDQGKGAIYVEDGDLKLKGKGTLNVTANYYNGIHGKDDVEVKNLTLNVNAVNHGIKGNDSVTIESGMVNIVCGGDGLHSDNSDVSAKGNQRGNVEIYGGSVTINSWGDAISAAYNAVIDEANPATPITLDFKTNKNSSYTGSSVPTSTTALYVRMSSTYYSNGGYTYAAYISGAWYKATYVGQMSSGGMGGGGRNSYYVYKIDRPNSATSFTLYRFQGANVTSFSTSSSAYNAKSDAKAFSTSGDTIQISSISNSKISFSSSWTNYSANGSDVSAKGIKAENEVVIKGGTINVKANDDGIHANKESVLENGNVPLGNVTISGGDITIDTSDDGVHADNALSIEGGKITITNSYEGIEAPTIRISGGETYVFATDDGVNAGNKSGVSPSILISGGFLDVTVNSSGDTDGIDSNGSYTQTGGVVITKGPGRASQAGGNSAALDTDGTVTLNGGTLIVFGGIEKTPIVASTMTKTLCSSSSVAVGEHTISFSSESYTATLKSATNGCVVYSVLGQATLR